MASPPWEYYPMAPHHCWGGVYILSIHRKAISTECGGEDINFRRLYSGRDYDVTGDTFPVDIG
jgi:hypothetical protein